MKDGQRSGKQKMRKLKVGRVLHLLHEKWIIPRFVSNVKIIRRHGFQSEFCHFIAVLPGTEPGCGMIKTNKT